MDDEFVEISRHGMADSNYVEMDEDNLATTAALVVFFLTLLLGLSIGVFISWFNIPYIMFHKPDTKSKRHGGEIVAEVLQNHGVEQIFTLCGGHISPILVAAEKIGIKVIDTRHEATAVFAADAVARMKGVVGVAAVTAGPGLTNTVTAVKNAQMAESPVLVIGGAAPILMKGRGALQDIDQMSLFKPICKYSATVNTVRDIAPTMLKALHLAKSGTPGPVFLELPIDVLYPYHIVSKELLNASSTSSGKNPGLVQRIVGWYLNNHLSNLYAGAWEKQDLTPYPIDVPLPTNQKVQKCAEMISKAKRPVLVLGSQVTLPPVPIEKIRSAVESLGIPTFLGGMSRGLLGPKSPIQCFHCRKDALKEADLILLVGTVCDFRLTYGRSLSRKAKIIAVNRDKSQLYKNSGMFWNPTVALQVDAGTFMKELSLLLLDYKCDSDWIDSLKAKDLVKEKFNLDMANAETDIHLNPLKVLRALEEVLPDNAILVADGGDFVGSAGYILRPRKPLYWLDPGAFGTLGVGGGFALGAKVCHPEAEVWIIYGDGSCGYSIMEYDTFTRFKLPVISVVGNDAGWTQISRDQKPMLGSDVGCRLVHSDYHKVAEHLGGKGFVIGREDNDNLKEKLQEARKQYQEGHSVMINALIGSTKFREGSISV